MIKRVSLRSKERWQIFQKLRQLFFRRTMSAPTTSLVLTRRRIFILPTRRGLLLALMLMIMLAGSMNYNNNLGYGFTFLLASMAVISILHTHRNLLGLRVDAGKVVPVFAGEVAQFQLWLDNRQHLARTALIWQKNSMNRQISESIVIDLAADQRTSFFFSVPTIYRGRLPLGQIRVQTCFPLGLFRAWAYINLDISTLVYPQPRGSRVLPFRNHVDSERSFHQGNGEDFIGHRNYKLGDSPRHVDWKVVARRQDWLIKQFGGSGISTVWLSWDDVRTLDHLEAVLSQLCLWVLIADSQGAQYGLKIPPHTIIEPYSGEQHRKQCLEILALYGLSAEQPQV